MDFLTVITDFTATLPEWLIWALGSALSFAESGLGLGLFFPGETAILIVSAALTNPMSAVVMGVLVAVFACAGDHVGYLLGRRYGGRIRETRIVRRFGVEHWDRSIALLEKQGARAILYTRPVPIVRILTPAAAGVAKATYPRFLAASFTGAAIWAVLYVGLGYLLRSSLDAVEKYLSRFGYIVTGVLALIVVIAIVRKVLKKRREKRGEAPAEHESPAVAGRRFVSFLRRRPVRTGLIVRAVLAVATGALVVAHLLMPATVTAGLLVLASLPAALPTLLGASTEGRIELTPGLQRLLQAVDRMLPVVPIAALAAAHRAPWVLAGTLFVPLVVIGAAQIADRFADRRGVPAELPLDRSLAIVATGGVFAIVLGLVLPDIRYVVGLGTLALFAAIVLAFIDGGLYFRRLAAPSPPPPVH